MVILLITLVDNVSGQLEGANAAFVLPIEPSNQTDFVTMQKCHQEVTPMLPFKIPSATVSLLRSWYN